MKRLWWLIPLLMGVPFLFAGTTGKIAGKITDEATGEPLPYADVFLLDKDGNTTGKGAATDEQGSYFIIGIRPGKYQIKAQYAGYQTAIVQDVYVRSDKTTEIDVQLSAEVEQLEAVVTTAKREKIVMGATSSEGYSSSEEISKMPVDDVQDVLKTKVGVTDRQGQLHYRGSRGNEVATFVNGMPVQDPAYGYSALDVATSSVQEITVNTGSFNAEYGGAMSGVVNIITKEGDPNKWSGSVYYRTDDFRESSLNKWSQGSDRLEFTLSGPEPISTYLFSAFGLKMPRDKRISYFASIAGENTDTRFAYNKVYDFDEHMMTQKTLNSPYLIDYGWYGFFPEKRYNTYSYSLKLKQRLTPNIKYTLSFTGNTNRWRTYDWYYYYCPDFSYLSKRSSYQVNLTLTHTLSPSTFYEVRFGRFYTERELTPAGWTPGDFAIDSTGYYKTLDDWQDVNQDGIPQVRQEWLDYNFNGMWDYGEPWWPKIEESDTFYNSDGTIDYIDTVSVDDLPPRVGEEPWYDLNNNGVFEPKMTNYNASFYPSPMDIWEPWMDGEPFRDGYNIPGLSYTDTSFHDDTLWADINHDGMKEWGEYIFGSQYENYTIALEETTDHGDGDWIDVNNNGIEDRRNGLCDYDDVNGNGRYDVGEPGEPFLDLNGNGYYDPPNYVYDSLGWEPYLDLNANGKHDDIDGFYERGFDRWAVWHKRSTDIWIAKGDITSQINKNNQIKSGVEFQAMTLNMSSIQYPEALYDGTPDGGPWPTHGVFRNFYTRSPKQLAFYVQDKMEYGGLIANIGLRADFFFQAGEVLQDTVADELTQILQGEVNEIAKLQDKISPRLGMSYPITDRAKLFFSYGHFYQLPGFDNLYQLPNQASNAGRLIGNPNLDYQRTVAYELGVAYALTDYITMQFSGYYKDIYDLLNTSTMRIGPLSQSFYKNQDYARSRGIEFTFDKAYHNYWTLSANYQFAFAYGKSSSDRSGYDAIFDKTSIPLQDLPLNWDQRHHITAVVDYRVGDKDHPKIWKLKLPSKWGLNLVFDWGTGFPYTPSKNNPNWESKPGEKAWERTNAMRMPNRYNLDLKFNKDFSIAKMDWSFVLEVSNVTNRRNVETVYGDTGLPDDANASNGLGNGIDYAKAPDHWSAPRNIKFGLKLAW